MLESLKDRLVVELIKRVNITIGDDGKSFKRCKRYLDLALKLSGVKYISFYNPNEYNVVYIIGTVQTINMSRYRIDYMNAKDNDINDKYAAHIATLISSGVRTSMLQYINTSHIISKSDTIDKYDNKLLHKITDIIVLFDDVTRYKILSMMYYNVTNCKPYDTETDRCIKAKIESMVTSIMTSSELKRCKMESKLAKDYNPFSGLERVETDSDGDTFFMNSAGIRLSHMPKNLFVTSRSDDK